MKPYELRNIILDLLLRIEKDKSFSHLLIDYEIKEKQINQKDVNLLTEIVYGTLQRKITLDYYIDRFISQKKKIDKWVRILLRMSFYQIIYLDKVPDHAVIHEAVEIAKKRGHKGISGLVNGVLRNLQRQGVPNTEAIQDKFRRLSIETSHPEWLVYRWVNEYGFETTKAMCEANLTRKAQSIRIQPLKISREEAIKQLEDLGFTVYPSELSAQGIVIEKGNILSTDLFKEGYVTIQDQSSMLVGELIHVKPNMQVLDACSAPGGKATHISEKMGNTGTVYAYDLHKNKINLIRNKAKDLELTNIQVKQCDARNLQQNHKKESFDRILVDAPCSGFGVIRGKPEIKYNKSETDVVRLSEIQYEILDHVSPLLKEGGLLVYSTCTVDVQENEEVVKKFIKEHKDFEIDTEFFEQLPPVLKKFSGITPYGIQLFPQNLETDGFFLSRLKKVSNK